MKKDKVMQPMKAIRLKCLDCCAGSSYQVKKCPIPDCPLFAFRHGKNPYRKSNMTDEQKQQATERLKKAREQKTLLENV